MDDLLEQLLEHVKLCGIFTAVLCVAIIYLWRENRRLTTEYKALVVENTRVIRSLTHGVLGRYADTRPPQEP